MLDVLSLDLLLTLPNRRRAVSMVRSLVDRANGGHADVDSTVGVD